MANSEQIAREDVPEWEGDIQTRVRKRWALRARKKPASGDWRRTETLKSSLLLERI